MEAVRWLFILLGSMLLSASMFSTKLAGPLGYGALAIVFPLFFGALFLYVKASFPPRQAELEDAPEEVDTKVGKTVANRVALVVALSIVALFTPVWIWIVPLFGLQAAYRASHKPGGVAENIGDELKATAKYLGLTAWNMVVFAICMLAAGVTALGTGAILYFWG